MSAGSMPEQRSRDLVVADALGIVALEAAVLEEIRMLRHHVGRIVLPFQKAVYQCHTHILSIAYLTEICCSWVVINLRKYFIHAR